MIMESDTKFVLVGLLNVVIFTLKMCSCQDYVCDIFRGIYNIICTAFSIPCNH